jgi:hypothetical protein
MRTTHHSAVAVLCIVSFFTAHVPAARADGPDAGAAPASDPARDAFKEGAAFVEAAEWAPALAAFERSLAMREHALTLYNIAVCQRYLGRYTLAHRTLGLALERNKRTSEMPELFVTQAQAYLGEVKGKLAKVTVTLKPRGAIVAVEGRPLTADPSDASGATFIANIAAPGAGVPLEKEQLVVVVDPGTSVFTFSLEGHETIEVRKTVGPGASDSLDVSMTEQPADVRVTADRPGALVRVDGADIGPTPTAIRRPPGTHRFIVDKEGFVPYEATLNLRPGQSVALEAKLAEEKTPLTKRWWFWTAAGVIATGIGVGVYFAVRPAPTRPDPDGGSVGWAATVR